MMQPPFMFQVRLTEDSHDFLLREFPSVHPNVFAHHVTLFYKPTAEQTEAMEEWLFEPVQVKVKVTGYYEDDKGQAVTVELPEGLPSGNRSPHITISTAEGVPPVYSNELIQGDGERASGEIVGVVDAVHSSRKNNPALTELHVFDFDGTIFRSPSPPDLPLEGLITPQKEARLDRARAEKWWDDIRTLEPPCVPERPALHLWYNTDVVAAFRKAMRRPQALVVVMTGRLPHFRERIAQILAHGEMVPDEIFVRPDPSERTESYKLATTRYLAGTMPNLRTIEFWEDRHAHLASFERKAHALGYAFVMHPVTPHPSGCGTPRRSNPSPTNAGLVARLKF